MRWLLAGIAFALLIGLAVFTAAVKSRNVHLRACIAAHARHIQALRIENSRRAPHLRREAATERLIARLKQMVRDVDGGD